MVQSIYEWIYSNFRNKNKWKKGEGYNGNGLYIGPYVGGFIIENIVLSNFTGSGIVLDDAYWNSIINPMIWSCDEYGVKFMNSAHQNQIIGGRISGSGKSSTSKGLHISGSGISIIGLDISSCNIGIDFDPDAGNRCTFVSPYFEDNGTAIDTENLQLGRDYVTIISPHFDPTNDVYISDPTKVNIIHSPYYMEQYITSRYIRFRPAVQDYPFLQLIPRGTPGYRSAIALYGSDIIADPVNFDAFRIIHKGTEIAFETLSGGTGTKKPVKWYMDLEFANSSNGIILVDRTTGTKYRLYVDNGTLYLEAVS